MVSIVDMFWVDHSVYGLLYWLMWDVFEGGGWCVNRGPCGISNEEFMKSSNFPYSLGG